jgi:hydrogenase expression/formation protein HypE
MNTPLRVLLNCPVPRLDFDVITLGHGSGGLLTQRLLESGVFQLLDNPELSKKADGAILNLEGPLAFSTDSYVVSPIFFPGGCIGDLAVNGTINDLAMCGATPKALSLSLIIEEGLSIEELWEVLLSIREACKLAGVHVVTGDTKVVERGKGDKLFINTSGIGKLHPKANLSVDRLQAGDALLISGPVARHGITIMGQRQGLGFQSSIKSDTRALHEPVSQLLDALGDQIKLLRDPTRGGVATVCNEIAQQAKLGMDLWEKQVPLELEVASACEMLGLDPLYIANEGLFMAWIDPAAEQEALAILRQQPYGSLANVIGRLTEEHPGKVVLHSAIGGKRALGMLTGDQLPRIC